MRALTTDPDAPTDPFIPEPEIRIIRDAIATTRRSTARPLVIRKCAHCLERPESGLPYESWGEPVFEHLCMECRQRTIIAAQLIAYRKCWEFRYALRRLLWGCGLLDLD